MHNKNRLLALIIVIGVAILGTVLLFASHAATTAVVIEPEQSTLAGGAMTINDVTASRGAAIVFTAASVCKTDRSTCPANKAFGLYLQPTQQSELTKRQTELWGGTANKNDETSRIKYILTFPNYLSSDGRYKSAAGIHGLMTDADRFPNVTNTTFIFSMIPVVHDSYVDSTGKSVKIDARSYEANQHVRAELTATATCKDKNGSVSNDITSMDVTCANDDVYAAAAQQIQQDIFATRASRHNDAIVRLGWEMTGNWFAWSIGSPSAAKGTDDGYNFTQYKNAWIRVVTVMRHYAPGLKFDFNTSDGNAALAEKAYPGDQYVDIIGTDTYDRGGSGGIDYTIPATAGWKKAAPYSSGAETYWNKHELGYVQDIAAMAKRHHKQTSLPEWGLQGTVDISAAGAEGKLHHPGGDNPYYIQAMYDWMNSLPASGDGSLAYQTFFWSEAVSEGEHRLDDASLCNAHNTFQKLYGTTAAVAPCAQPPSADN